MWGFLVIGALLIGACYWVVHPLIQTDRRRQDLAGAPANTLENLKEHKEAVYATIHELEFDLNMGKLTQEDFEILKRQYLQEAAGYMQQIDQFKFSEAIMTAPKKTVREENVESVTTEASVQAPSGNIYLYCSACGENVAANNRFCTSCGAKLPERA